ncbi:hypothetical protein [Sphingomonas sp.]|uniref:hypothetical protein n=1 Tax=Sphingomonas sp. TaxID=28214 RepID=UPI001DDE6852|nr:hypothetical protein [Sphingomonas sp.]MBX9796164.1 hypothetical protein [Sphingomonas sp.]
MKSDRTKMVKTALIGFMVAGVVLILGSWAITGQAPSAGWIAPFVLILVAMGGLQAKSPAKSDGKGDIAGSDHDRPGEP